MKPFGLIIVSMFLLMGCQDVQYPEAPENLLPKEKMVEILADAYIGNAARSKSVNNRILRTKGVHLDSILYTKHQVDSLTFAESNNYYASNLDVYTEIITEVESLLLMRKARMDSLGEKKKKKKQDTLANEKAKAFKPVDSAQLGTSIEDEEE